MESIVERMQDDHDGVPVKTVKSFISKIPSVFTGADLVSWIMKHMNIDQVEALHLANLMASYGYLFPIDDHVLTVKNDGTFYRFQTPYFWPSYSLEPEHTDYAVYLCKRTMQNKTRLELTDYEAENLARLQKMFSRKWEFIFMQAEAQAKVDKKRDKLERKVLDSQERAFWDVQRPACPCQPGCVNTTEIDIRKVGRMDRWFSPASCSSSSSSSCSSSAAEKDAPDKSSLKQERDFTRSCLDRGSMKVSKVLESYLNYFELYAEYDPFIASPEPSNPWISDNPEFWEQEKGQGKDISCKRVRKWAFGLHELLKDPVGKECFIKFLDKEFSCENLRFWEAVQELKALRLKDVNEKAQSIWQEFLSNDATYPINIDSKSLEATKKNMEQPDRWTFDIAAAHLYHLMKSDSYPRFLRSDMYKEILGGSKKKTSVKGLRSIVTFTKKESSLPLQY